MRSTGQWKFKQNMIKNKEVIIIQSYDQSNTNLQNCDVSCHIRVDFPFNTGVIRLPQVNILLALSRQEEERHNSWLYFALLLLVHTKQYESNYPADRLLKGIQVVCISDCVMNTVKPGQDAITASYGPLWHLTLLTTHASPYMGLAQDHAIKYNLV